jgi:hypothetical protein
MSRLTADKLPRSNIYCIGKIQEHLIGEWRLELTNPG